MEDDEARRSQGNDAMPENATVREPAINFWPPFC
jgi:hypothetical protein